jgi:predicted nucleotidyltransferase
MTDTNSLADRAFAELVAEARVDPSVLGLYVHGSRVFEGMATELSDYDVGLIVDESEQGRRWQRPKTRELDLWTTTSLATLRSGVLNNGDENRYIMAHALIVIDRLDGALAALVSEAAHFDAAESVRLLLWTLFALHQRVRPPNKYLRWELERHPLGDPCWELPVLLPRLQRVLADGDAETQRSLFRDLEPLARSGGHDATVDGWGDDLRLMHG